MYKVPELLKSIRLSEIEIPNQEKIIAATGSKLDLEQAYKVIEAVSENFSQWDEKAIEADSLLSQLIESHLRRIAATAAVELAVAEKEVISIDPQIELEITPEKAFEEVILDVPILNEGLTSNNHRASAARKRKLRLMKLKLGLKKQQSTNTQL